MNIWHIVIICIFAFIPILIGARFRAKKDNNENNYTIGNIIQICAILNTCILVFGEIIEKFYAFYISLGIILIIYIITFAYIYAKFFKK